MPFNPLTILMADDDIEDIELLEIAITTVEPRASLHKVTNGKAAVDYLEKKEDYELPCLIILDYNMPELTGLEVLALLSKQQRYKSIPKIVLSTSSTTAYINDCMKNGATEYVVKPNDMSALTIIAKKMLTYCK